MSAAVAYARTANSGAGSAPLSVVAYGRISRDRIGAGMGVTRQLNAIDAYAEAHELGPVAASYTDNDLSGYSGKPRPGFDQLMADIAAGKVGTLIAWHVDRLTRQPAELETLMTACREHGVTLRTVTAGELDPTSPDGLLMARIAGAIASYESDHKRRRVTMKHDELAKAGKFHGGRRRFGYEPGMTAIRESEAAAIREAAAAVLAGETLYAVAKSLNSRGITTPEGNAWTGSNLGVMLRRPHLAGLRVHKGEIVGRADWEPVLDRATHERVEHLLSDPARRKSIGNARRYLLGGLGTCYTCGAKLRARPTTAKSPNPAYMCTTGRHVHRPANLVDEAVVSRVVNRLTKLSEAGELRLDRDDTADELAALARSRDELAARRDELAELMATGTLSVDAYGRAVAAVERELEAVERELVATHAKAATPVAVLAGMTGAGAAKAWEAADLGRRRAVIDTLCTVQLRGGPTGGAKFDPEDVVLTWRIG